MTILILGYFYPKAWVVWITGKTNQKFGDKEALVGFLPPKCSILHTYFLKQKLPSKVDLMDKVLNLPVIV